MKNWGMAIIAIVALLLSGTGAFALPTLSGSITYDTGIYAPSGTDWASSGNKATLSWYITYFESTKTWNYMYTWSGYRKALSHIILEVTPGAVASDFMFSPNELVTMGGIDTYSATSQGNSNPGMPGPMYGMKLEPTYSTTLITFGFDTWRPPVWGDFYAKDGNSGPVYAYNTGFLNDDPTSNAGDGRHIVVPDGAGASPTPEPGTMLLLGLGLIGIAIVLREMKR
jgi:hypothetical protein